MHRQCYKHMASASLILFMPATGWLIDSSSQPREYYDYKRLPAAPVGGVIKPASIVITTLSLVKTSGDILPLTCALDQRTPGSLDTSVI